MMAKISLLDTFQSRRKMFSGKFVERTNSPPLRVKYLEMEPKLISTMGVLLVDNFSPLQAFHWLDVKAAFGKRDHQSPRSHRLQTYCGCAVQPHRPAAPLYDLIIVGSGILISFTNTKTTACLSS
ncbi:hypothetical protein ECG_00509 [Echinococcus granulosus]|nr:hypothetical protein ECG_00509 [Echinococcus granulosus]